MFAAQLCVRTISGFSMTSVSNSLGSYSWQLPRQLCFPTQRCRSITWKSSDNSFDDYSKDFRVPDMSMASSEQKGAISKISAKRKHSSEDFDMDYESFFAERNRLRDELVTLNAKVRSAVRHLSLVVDYLKDIKIPATSEHEQNIINSSEDNPLKRKLHEFDDRDEPSNKKPRSENKNPIKDTFRGYLDSDD